MQLLPAHSGVRGTACSSHQNCDLHCRSQAPSHFCLSQRCKSGRGPEVARAAAFTSLTVGAFGTSQSSPSLPLPIQNGLSLERSRDLQELLHCLFLAEGSYKVIDHGPEGAASLIATLMEGFPSELLALHQLTWTLSHVNHRYLLAETKGTIYVAFMGTKQRRDLIANATVLQVPLWPDELHADSSAKAVPAAHKGFLSRTEQVPVEILFDHACRLNKRLVFTGHSLGAAVAVLSMLKLLKQLPLGSHPDLACITFACPAVGNAALADLVTDNGWQRYFRNHLIPEDIVPRLLAPPEGVAASAALQLQQAAAAEAAGNAASLKLRLPSFSRPSFSRKRTRSGSPGKRKQHKLSNSGPTTSTGPLNAGRNGKEDAAASQACDCDDASPSASGRSFQASSIAADASTSGAEGPPESEQPDFSSGLARWPSIGGQKPAQRLHSRDGQQQREISIRFRGRRRTWVLRPPSMQALQSRVPAMQAAAGNAASMAQAAPKRAMTALREQAARYQQHSTLPSADSSVELADSQLGLGSSEKSAASLTAAAAQKLQAADSPPGNASLHDDDMASLLLGLASEEQMGDSLPSSSNNESASSQRGSLPVEMKAPDAALPPKSGSQSTSTSEKALSSSSSSPIASATATQDAPQSSHSARLSDMLPIAQPLAQGSALNGHTSSTAGQSAAADSVDRRARAGQLANSGVQLISRTAGAGVRTAGAGVRTAARFVGTPIAAARRRYFPVGNHLYIFPWAIAPVAADVAMLSPAPELQLQEAARELGAEDQGSADASLARNPLKRAAGMHRMAYHRFRLQGILNKSLQNLTLGQMRQLAAECAKQRPGSWASQERPIVVLGDLSPPMRPRHAEAFLPWKLPGTADVRQMMDDLGSLSEQGIRSEAPSREPERWRWLHPWAWVSGLSWRGPKPPPLVDITLHIYGTGLENCSHVQVLVPDGQPCPATILHRPRALPPATAYALLGRRQPQVLRQAALAGLWAMYTLRRGLSAFDRANTSGVQDTLLVKAQVPPDALQRAGRAFLQTGHADCAGLTVALQSDFKEYRIPLHLHSGASWLVSDLTQSSRSMLDWLAPKV